MRVKRGEIYYADLGKPVGSEQGGLRPVVIIQNDSGNFYSPTVIVAAVSSRVEKLNLPTHFFLDRNKSGLPKDSIVLLEQLRTLDKTRLKKPVGQIPDDSLGDLDYAISVSLGLFRQRGNACA